MGFPCFVKGDNGMISGLSYRRQQWVAIDAVNFVWGTQSYSRIRGD